MKKFSVIALAIVVSSLTGCAEFNQALNQSLAQSQQGTTQGANSGTAGINPEVLQVYKEDMEFSRQAQAKKAAQNAELQACLVPAEHGRKAELETYRRYGVNIPANEVSAHDVALLQSCLMGKEAAKQGDTSGFQSLVSQAQREAKSARSLFDVRHLGYVMGEAVAYKMGFEMVAGYKLKVR